MTRALGGPAGPEGRAGRVAGETRADRATRRCPSADRSGTGSGTTNPHGTRPPPPDRTRPPPPDASVREALGWGRH
ncbi:hypothetical protein TNCT6_36060 [Streptomyces sp. 6-11-2]|nr:hypothetical protein TNCT6_36060 [Streptomyces sp. 6-11-2]